MGSAKILECKPHFEIKIGKLTGFFFMQVAYCSAIWEIGSLVQISNPRKGFFCFCWKFSQAVSEICV